MNRENGGNRNKRNGRGNVEKGFTLIEILIVVAIIGILSALVTVNLNSARERARDVQRKSDVKQIQQAFELYKNDQNPPDYPEEATWKEDLVAGSYMKEEPIDPKEKSAAGSWVDYTYSKGADLTYSLAVCLENAGDQDKDAVNGCTSGVSYTKTQP